MEESLEFDLKNINYEFFLKERYTIVDFKHKDTEYSAICNNGFIKLHTNKGKAYWLCQNESGHITPDWKFHISIHHEDLMQAFDIIVKIFIQFQCRSGLKVAYLKENQNITKGRELTIYIYKHDELYEKSYIGKSYNLCFGDEHSEEFWLKMVQKIESELRYNRIRSNGCAIGDLALGDFVSLRNEAYVYFDERNEDVYPLDEMGWNARKHVLPFKELYQFKKLKDAGQLMIYWGIGLIGLLLSLIAFWYFYYTKK